jgi:hypothetical protein
MAVSNENILTRGLSGSIGRMITFRQRAGQTITSKFRRPTTVPATEGLIEVRTVFASAIAYAKAVVQDPVIKALYQAAVKGGQTAFNVATSDALNSPRVTNILTDSYHGNPGNAIIVLATDDFKVVDVTVSVEEATGGLLEQGNAVLQPGGSDWLYKATMVNQMPADSKITAVAMDLPGNSTAFSIKLI